MNHAGAKFAETVLLFAALFCTLPHIPSNYGEQLSLFPGAVFAVVLFAGSRLLRWRGSYLIALAESLAFSLFAWGANAIGNALIST